MSRGVWPPDPRSGPSVEPFSAAQPFPGTPVMFQRDGTCLRLTFLGLAILGATWLAAAARLSLAAPNAISPPRERHFQLDYGATLVDLPVGARVRVWLPIPSSNDHQIVRRLTTDLPAPAAIGEDVVNGNTMLYFETTVPAARELTFSAPYHIVRREARGLAHRLENASLSPEQRRLFLAANKKIPLTGKPTTLLNMLRLPTDPLELARVLYLRVDDHVRYDKSRPGYGNGDV